MSEFIHYSSLGLRPPLPVRNKQIKHSWSTRVSVYFISMASYKQLTLSICSMPITVINIKTAPKMRPFITPLTVALFSSSTRARQTKVQEVVDKIEVVKLKRNVQLQFYLSYLSYFCHLIFFVSAHIQSC